MGGESVQVRVLEGGHVGVGRHLAIAGRILLLALGKELPFSGLEREQAHLVEKSEHLGDI